MQYQLLRIQDKEIKYKIRKSKKARRISIVIRPEGWVELVVPKLVPVAMGKQFLQSKRRWIADKISQVENNPGMLAWDKPGNFQKYKPLALSVARRKIKYYNGYYGFNVNGIFVRNQKTRWGSCSLSGNLSFNYKIVFLPERIADYLIVHELCHLGQMNHSKKFWLLVEKMLPDYKELRKSLKRL